jgi:hypothetical protein
VITAVDGELSSRQAGRTRGRADQTCYLAGAGGEVSHELHVEEGAVGAEEAVEVVVVGARGQVVDEQAVLLRGSGRTAHRRWWRGRAIAGDVAGCSVRAASVGAIAVGVSRRGWSVRSWIGSVAILGTVARRSVVMVCCTSVTVPCVSNDDQITRLCARVVPEGAP